MTIDKRRQELEAAAVAHAGTRTAETLRALCLAAAAYQDARMSAASGATAAVAAAARNAGEPVWPFGKKKGQPLSQVSKRDLEWLVGVTEESLADPAKERFRDANLYRLEEARAELARR